MKKLHSTIKQLTLLICMLCTTSTFADDSGTCGENLTWTYVEATKTLTISGSGKMSVGNYPWSKYRTDISKVVIENGVTSIGSSAFADCANLYSITIPNSVVNVGGNAFQGIKKVIWLTNTPPSGWKYAKGTVNYVPNNQFGTTNDIIVYPFLSSLFEVDGIKYVPVSPSERTCDAIDCVYDESKTEVNINNSVTYQGVDMKVMNVQPYTFYQNPYLQKVNLDVSGRLSQYALSNCPNLQIALLGNNVTNIDDYAFSNCQKLESIIIPDAVNDIGQYAFSDCSNMTSVHIGDGTSTIGQYAFSGCSNMTNLNIGNKTKYINPFAFQNCSSLTAISIPGSVLSIGDNTFSGCISLKDVVIEERKEEGGTIIIDNCSVNWGQVKTITLDVAKGDELSFDYSMKGSNVKIYNADGSLIGGFSPVNSNIILKNSYKQTFDYTNTGQISIVITTFSYSGSECSFTNMKLKKSKYLSLGSNGKSPLFTDCPLYSVSIDRNISYRTQSSSGYSPFYRNTSLCTVKITDNVEEITTNEFYGCTNLQYMQIDDGVTTIGDWAFSGCSSLKSFSFGTNVSNIGKEAFSDCTSLTQLTSHATTPPICGEQALDDINKWTCKLTVPYGCIGIYQTADQWKEFFFIEEGEKTKEEIAINEENFPDENFRSWLLSQSYGSDGVLTEEEIAGVNKINVYRESIQSLKGIEYFTALTYLNCSFNPLTSLDVSKNTALTYLNCNGNQLTLLDVSKNTALTELYCTGNQLTSLDVSKNTALTSLNCYLNLLTSIDVSKNTALTYLSCSYNQLTSLDLSKNTALTRLDCYSNQLTSLDLSKNTSLTELFCDGNQLTSLDVSKNTALTRLDCYSNQLTSLDVSKNTALTQLYCYSNQLTSLDLSGCTALTQLYCYQNRIKDDCMDALVTSLPIVSSRTMRVMYYENEQNVMIPTQVAAAKAKGWMPLYYDGTNWKECVGSDPSGIQGIMLDKKVNVPIYDLNGRRLTEPQKGINIIGGKKVVIK